MRKQPPGYGILWAFITPTIGIVAGYFLAHFVVPGLEALFMLVGFTAGGFVSIWLAPKPSASHVLLFGFLGAMLMCVFTTFTTWTISLPLILTGAIGGAVLAIAVNYGRVIIAKIRKRRVRNHIHS